MRIAGCWAVMILFLAGCRTGMATIPTATMQPTVPRTSTAVVTVTARPTRTASPTQAPVQTRTSAPPAPPTALPTPQTAPVIHTWPGDLYETLFTVAVGSKSHFQYERFPDHLRGPSAIAVLPDDTLLILDSAGYSFLVRYDPAGNFLNSIPLFNLGLYYVADMRVFGNEIYLLDKGYKNIRIVRLSSAGEFLGSEAVPYDFPVEAGIPLVSGLTGITMDCQGEILLEIAGGSPLFRLTEVQHWQSQYPVETGYLCNHAAYQVTAESRNFSITTGQRSFTPALTKHFGGATLLKVLPDGSFYAEVTDFIEKSGVFFDQTVHYLNADGSFQAVARVPQSDFSVTTHRRMAVGASGEVYALLTHPDSVEVVRLNFYPQIDPIIPGAASPHFSVEEH